MSPRIVILSITCLLGCGCGLQGIWIDPLCPPAEMNVGQSVDVDARETNPGASPRFSWEIEPADAGRFANARLSATRFTADKPGEAVVTIAAADGLFAVLDHCPVVIRAVALAVRLEFSPAAPEVGDEVTLTCQNIGTQTPTEFLIRQVGTATVQLARKAPNIVTFTPSVIGELSFQCVGRDDAGGESEPAQVTFRVTAGRPTGPR